jgi:hypothetical protein
MRTWATQWGSTAAERAVRYPCEDVIPHAEVVVHRGIDVLAPTEVTFRWLCQLKVAPYSYDWIDNLGRRSPRELTPGLEELRLGDRWITIFELVAFEPGRSITLLNRSRAFGRLAISYQVEGSRLVAVIAIATRRPWTGLLCWADAVMMRKQLQTFKQLAEAASSPVG